MATYRFVIEFTKLLSMKFQLKIFLIVLLLSSLAANCISLITIYNSFKKIHYNRIFPAGYIYSLTKRKDIKVEYNTFETLIFVGDSRSEMWYTKTLKKNFNVINIAHGGQTSGQVVLQLENVSAIHNAWIILQVGINDIHPLGIFQDHETVDIAIANCKININKIVDYLVSLGNKVVVTTIFPPSRIPFFRKIFWPTNGMEFIDDINQFIKRLPSEKAGVYVIDSYKLLAGRNHYLDDRYVDHDFFLHINREGYELLNSSLKKILNTYVNS